MHQYAKFFGFIPAGIGLTLVIWLWSQPFNGFHSPPIIFRIMGTFVSLIFISAGAGIFFGVSQSQNLHERLRHNATQSQQPTSTTRKYECTTCGAPVTDGSNVSPNGDVKCEHCGKWFNVHQ